MSPRKSLTRVAVRGAGLFVVVGLASLFFQPIVHSQASDALPYAKTFLVTGNYAVGSVDLAPASGSGGFLTGTIPMSGVPANAEVLAAYVYWETISTNVAQVDGAKFRGSPIAVVKSSYSALSGSTAPCWSGGGGGGATFTMAMYRGDVLRLLPTKADGSVIVNDADLISNGLALNTITLPEAGTGNQVPSSAGASLLVIYRDITQPLRSVILYDGLAIKGPGATLTQNIRGFLQSSSSHLSKFTAIGGSGAPNSTDRLFFKGTQLATNPFVASATPSSDRGWSSPTFDVTAQMPGNDFADGFGETVTAQIDHTNDSPYECISLAAMVFSTTIEDADFDGLPDRLEDVSGLKFPNGALMPDLHAMGASKVHKDMFLEVGGMTADPGTSYGVGAALETDSAGHNHLPTPAVIKLVGDVYKNAPVWNPDGQPGIRLHVDAGPNYASLGGAYADPAANEYLISGSHARGGESIREVACGTTASLTCHFPNYPGTVSWKIGFQVHRDAPVGASGEELSAAAMDACDVSGDCRRRFDQDRMNLFHYLLYAHGRGKPKELCNTGTTAQQEQCKATNPDFHVPSTSSGSGDLPGGDGLVTLGFWGHGFVGSDFIRAATTVHELGHNLKLSHGGDAASGGLLNCKPNYLSIMNYMFQLSGLRDDAGVAHLDYSRASLPSLNEGAVVDGVTGYSYRTAWYTPLLPGTLGYTLGIPAATKYCDGAALPSPLPEGWVPMGRINGPVIASPVDWNGDGLLVGAGTQDINFDGTVSASLTGSNDWTNIRLDQVGSRRNMAGFSLGMDFTTDEDFTGGADFTDGLEFAFGLDYTGGVDTGGGLDFEAFGLDYTGGVDTGTGIDFFGLDYVGGRELDRLIAAAHGNTPANEFKACVIGGPSPSGCQAGGPTPLHRSRLTWKIPDVGTVVSYSGQRVLGATVLPSSVPVLVGGAALPAPAITLLDNQELIHGQQYTYYIVPLFTDGPGPASNFSTITAENDAPVAFADSYSVAFGGTLSIAARGVLTNDTDTDSPLASLTAVLATGPAHASAFTLNTDGSFTYTPAVGYTGTDTFTYYAKDVTPISARNVAVAVTIAVNQPLPVPPYTVTIDPLKTPANLGSAVPIDWEVRNASGVRLVSLSTLVTMESVYNGPAPAGGCVASATGSRALLYSPASGATGGSNFRILGQGYRFNWDSTTALPTGPGCYTILLTFDDGAAPRLTTAVQLR
jgi:hypothetical protein